MIEKARGLADPQEKLIAQPFAAGINGSSPLVRPSVWLGAAASIGFIVIAWLVVQYPANAIDLGILAWMQSRVTPTLDVAGRWLSYLGSEAIGVMAIALLIWLAIERRWREAGLLVAMVGGAQLLNDLLKEIFHRARPMPVAGFIPAQQYSFPSGHAMASAAFYLFVLWFCWKILPGWAHVPLLISLAFVCLAIGLARMYVGAHYFTDVVAGGLGGYAWADGVLLAAHRLAKPNRARIDT